MFNWSDHFPILGIFDLQGVRKRCRDLVSKVNVFVGEIIKEHRVKRDKINGGGVDERFGDFVDVLLDLEKDNMLNDFDMIAVLWVFFFLSFSSHILCLNLFLLSACMLGLWCSSFKIFEVSTHLKLLFI